MILLFLFLFVVFAIICELLFFQQKWDYIKPSQAKLS